MYFFPNVCCIIFSSYGMNLLFMVKKKKIGLINESKLLKIRQNPVSTINMPRYIGFLEN